MTVRSVFSTYIIPITATVVIHSVLIASMMFSWASTSQKTVHVRPKFIEAKVVEFKPKATHTKQQAKPKKIDLTRQKQELEKKKMDAEVKRKADLKKKADRKKAEDKKLADKKKREKEALDKQKAEQARKQQLLKEQRQAEMDKALAEEDAMLLEEQYATEAQSYSALIAQRIEQKWSKPPSARRGMECKLRIQMLPTGRVVTVNLIKSSGNDAFDRSAIQAVQRADTFPEINKMSLELFEREFRQFTMTFSPQDSRL